MKGGINLKINITENQQKILAEIFEKTGLGLGTAILINSFILDKPTVSTLEVFVFGFFSIAFIFVSIFMRK